MTFPHLMLHRDSTADRSTPGSEQQTGSRHSAYRVVLLAVLLTTFVLHLLVVAEPLGRDQGIFAYIGQTILRGGIPYRDAWDHKPPGLYAVYALAFALFGQDMSSVHLFEGICLTVGALMVYLVGRRLHGEVIGLVGAFFYGSAATLLFEWWDRGQAEIYMGLMGTVAVYWLLRAHDDTAGVRTSAAAMFLSGFFCGATIVFKPSGLPLLAGVGLCVFLLGWRQGARRVCVRLVWLALGCMTAFLPLVVSFAAASALDDLVQAVLVFNTYHARIGGNPTLAGSIGGTLDYLASMNVLAPLALLGLWAVLSRRGTAAVVLPIWLVASAAGIWTQGKFFSYHWSPVLPPLALLAAWGLVRLWVEVRHLRWAWEKTIAVLVCLLILIGYGVALQRDHAPKWQRNLAHLTGQTTQAAYYAAFGHDIQGRDKYSFSETLAAAHYIAAHTTPDDYVLVWGFQALVNYLADRRAPTRYIFTYPLTFDRPETVFRVDARRIFLRDLNTRPPRYIILVSNDVNPLQAVDSLGLLAGFPEFDAILRQYYRLETDIGEFHIYRRTDA